MRVGWTAAAIVAIDPFLIYFSTLILSETLFTFLLLAGFFYMLEIEREPSTARAAFSGIMFSLAALCRSILSPLLPLLALSIFYLHGIRGNTSRRLFLVFVCGLCLPLAAWSLCLHQKTGNLWTFISAQKRMDKLRGSQSELHDDEDAIKRWQEGMREEVKLNNLQGPIEIDRYFWKKTLDTMRANPLQTLQLMTQKIFKLWRFRPYFSYSSQETAISARFMAFLVPLAVLGLCVFGMKKEKDVLKTGGRPGYICFPLYDDQHAHLDTNPLSHSFASDRGDIYGHWVELGH